MNSKQYHWLWVTMLFLLSTACKVQKVSSTFHSEPSLVTYGPAWGAMWQQKASEYKALCFQAYNIARMRLDILAQQTYSKPMAIVTDIDETVLDNSPYSLHQALRDSVYSDASWMEWTAKTDCDTIPGALSFLRYAAGKGVHIFYITNRLEAERGPTLKNLQQYNFPEAISDHLFMKQTTSGKEERRQVVAKTHEILLLFGDNLSDFSAVFDKQPFAQRNEMVNANASLFGERFIVLPNAMYGDWEGALYNFNYKLTPQQKDSVIKRQLKNYQ